LSTLTIPKNKLCVKDYNSSTFEGTAPRSKEHLAVYCAVVLGTILPHPAFCEGHMSPLDAIWDAYADVDIDAFPVWLAMRGSGKTHNLAVLSYLESVFKENCGTTVLGGSMDQSQRCINYLRIFWQMPKAPIQMLITRQVAGHGYRLTNGSWVQALAASQKSVRGPHPQRLRLDEVDEMAKPLFDAALGQPKANYGIPEQTLASSTLHNAFGLMSELVDDVDKRGVKVYRWCVEEVREPRGFWKNDEIARKKKITTEAMWDAEYLLKRPTIGESIYDFELVRQAYERGKNDEVNLKLKTQGGIDWGYTCTVLHIIQDMKERFSVPKTLRWEYIELTDRCEAIADECIKSKVTTLYTDISPKDSNITLQKIFRQRRIATEIIPVAFGKWKGKGIDVVRFLFDKKMIGFSDLEFRKELQKYHYKNAEHEVVDKVEDHTADALTAWAASKSHLLVDEKK